LIPTRIEL